MPAWRPVFRAGGAGGGGGNGGRFLGGGSKSARLLMRASSVIMAASSSSSSTSSAAASSTLAARISSLGKSAVTAGSMSVLGDAIAQGVQASKATDAKKKPAFEVARSARMGGFGLLLYGPMQHYWYAFLDRQFPIKTNLAHFANKLVWNQIMLGPTVLVTVFTWTNMTTPSLGTMQQRWDATKTKIKHDLVPTMLNGWKFWVPAAAVNFSVVPLPYQVLYMSCCGVFWNFYLSLASNTPAPVAADKTNANTKKR
ncbi:hypothetical protein PPROV_000817900 [Pycnococcus provasolii]|uniref:Peroxisomal membrane protein MPV17 n=1 Tax=Pycnococcus provasolii TaxID=41880 RepID=A0A830HQM6_9CHLO|nr:hypothetical protein PPROV_000817900 [Pycnococcus provasolii]